MMERLEELYMFIIQKSLKYKIINLTITLLEMEEFYVLIIIFLIIRFIIIVLKIIELKKMEEFYILIVIFLVIRFTIIYLNIIMD